MTASTQDAFTLCLDLTGCIDLTYTNTDGYPSENSWDVTDASGVVIASGADASGTVGDCLPPCLDPTVLTAANVTETSADLSWIDNASSGLSNVEYGVAGFTLGAGTQILGTTNVSESISGLSTGVTYEYYVQSDCGVNQSAWVGPISFTTPLCDPSSQCDYTFNMADSYGDGWNGNEISFVQNGVVVSTHTIATGFSATATISLCDGVSTDVVYSTVGSWGGEVSFDVVDPYGINVATLAQGALFGSAGQVLATFTTNCTPPACIDPAALSASNVTVSSADLSWVDANSGSANVEYGVAGFTLGAGTQILGTTNNPESISGLTSNTTYEFYVQADCGDFQSNWVGPIAFTTPCSVLALPWSEGMENAGVIPGCWSMEGTENWLFSNTPGFNHIGNNNVITGNTDTDGYFAWVDASGGVAGDSATLTSPAIDISSLSVPQLSFYELSHNEGFSNSNLFVEVYNGATWDSVATYNTNSSGGWEEKIIDLSALTFTGPAQVRFTFSEPVPGDYYDDIAIDDVSFEETPNCLEPDNLMASNITTDAADLSWTDIAASGISNVEYGVSGFTLGSGTQVLGSANTTESISGLASGTSYDFYVQSDCGTGQSLWAGPYSFSTNLCGAADQCDYTLRW
jgi:hypothetical protein